MLKEIFISFAKSLGLTEDHIIFPIPIGSHQLGREEGHLGTSQV